MHRDNDPKMLNNIGFEGIPVLALVLDLETKATVIPFYVRCTTINSNFGGGRRRLRPAFRKSGLRVFYQLTFESFVHKAAEQCELGFDVQ